MAEYSLKYAGTVPPRGDVTPAFVLAAEGDGQKKSFRVDMTGTAYAVAKNKMPNPMGALLGSALVDVEARLRSGTEPRQLKDVSLHSSELSGLEELAKSQKQCSWQSGTSSALRCGAARDSKVLQTTIAACEKCEVPDQRWICVHFVHPQIVDSGTFDDPHARAFLDAQCNIGVGTAGKECMPGGRECWERRIADLEADETEPSGYIVDPAKPFTNKRAVRRLIRHARGVIRWYERDMPAKVLEIVADEIAATDATRIRLLSGDLDHGGKRQRARVRKDLEDFREEFGSVGVEIEWRELQSGEVPHDRVFLTEAAALNLPPVNTLLKGDTSEIAVSALTTEWFDALWGQAVPIG